MHVVVIAQEPSSSQGAATVGDGVTHAWRGVRPHDKVTAVRMSGGGEGFLAAVAAGVSAARRHTAEVANARGYAVGADWLQLPDGTAVIESAAACGTQQLPPEQRNPRLTTSYGVGQLIDAAVAAGAPAVVVGLGHSAAADAGAGLATALGHRLLRGDGNRIKVGGEFLEQLERIDPAPGLSVPLTALYDSGIRLADAVTATTIPMAAAADASIAPDAAAVTADADTAALLGRNLARLADIVERDLPGGPWRDLVGAGAGGGMGFGLAAFAGATLTSGAQWLAELIGLGDLLAEADAVVTQGSSSPVAQEVQRLARAYDCRVLELSVDAGSGQASLAASVADLAVTVG